MKSKIVPTSMDRGGGNPLKGYQHTMRTGGTFGKGFGGQVSKVPKSKYKILKNKAAENLLFGK